MATHKRCEFQSTAKALMLWVGRVGQRGVKVSPPFRLSHSPLSVGATTISALFLGLIANALMVLPISFTLIGSKGVSLTHELALISSFWRIARGSSSCPKERAVIEIQQLSAKNCLFIYITF